MPNKSPEPTAVGAVSSDIAVHRHESAVAQLSTLGGYTRLAFFVELVWLAEAFEDSDFDE